MSIQRCFSRSWPAAAITAGNGLAGSAGAAVGAGAVRSLRWVVLSSALPRLLKTSWLSSVAVSRWALRKPGWPASVGSKASASASGRFFVMSRVRWL